MYVVKLDAKALGKDLYVMENPIHATNRICRAMLFITAGEAEEFKEKNHHFERLTVVEVTEDAIIKDMQKCFTDLRAKSKSSFREAVMDAKDNGVGEDELHELVDAPLRT